MNVNGGIFMMYLQIRRRFRIMKFNFLKDKKCWCFAAGIATAVVGKKIATSEKVRSMCVSGLAKGMKFQQEAKETLQNMREEAEDMCYEAKSQLNDEEE